MKPANRNELTGIVYCVMITKSCHSLIRGLGRETILKEQRKL